MPCGAITGATVFCTVTLKLAVPVLFAASGLEQLTLTVPSAKVDPDAGTQVALPLPATASVKVALNVTVAPVGPVASTVMSAGTVTAGAIVSLTITLKLAEPRLPAASLCEQVTR